MLRGFSECFLACNYRCGGVLFCVSSAELTCFALLQSTTAGGSTTETPPAGEGAAPGTATLTEDIRTMDIKSVLL